MLTEYLGNVLKYNNNSNTYNNTSDKKTKQCPLPHPRTRINFFKLPSQKKVVLELEIEVLLKKCICQEHELEDNSKKALIEIFLTISKIKTVH